MAQANIPPPIFIARPAALQRLVEELQGEPIITVDTESNSLYAYYERVCLIQFSTPTQDYLVDPLALEDLGALGPIFASPKIEKVFHAAEYDLLCLKRDFQFSFSRLFDTMIAARILGHENLGLGAILEANFGVQVDKRHQRANWGQRPLPPKLMAYAQVDTHYLIQVREQLHGELLDKGLWPLAQEDFARLERVNGGVPRQGSGQALRNGSGQALGDRDRSANGEANNDFWRISGAYDLNPAEAAVLCELNGYREQVAQALNLPVFKVIGDRTLVALAAQRPRTADELSRAPGMSVLQMKRHAKGLLRAIERGVEAEPRYPPRYKRPDERYLRRLEVLKNWRKATGQRMGVGSDVVLPRDLLYALAEQDPQDDSELRQVLVEVPWRLKNFGEEILRVLEKL